MNNNGTVPSHGIEPTVNIYRGDPAKGKTTRINASEYKPDSDVLVGMTKPLEEKPADETGDKNKSDGPDKTLMTGTAPVIGAPVTPPATTPVTPLTPNGGNTGSGAKTENK